MRVCGGPGIQDSDLEIINCETMKRTKRVFSSAFKAEVALEAIKGVKTVSELAQEYELHPAQITQWQKQFLDQSASVFESDKKKNEELDQLKKERDELFRQMGELKFENNWYKKKLK